MKNIATHKMYIPVQVIFKTSSISASMNQNTKVANQVADALKCNLPTLQDLKMKVSKSHNMKVAKSLKSLLNLVGLQTIQIVISNYLRQCLLTWKSLKMEAL